MNFNVRTFKFKITIRKLFPGLSTPRIMFSDFLVLPPNLSLVMEKVAANKFKAL